MKLNERGGVIVEIAIIAPVLILVLLFVVSSGRVVSARSQVDGAARDAARAASLKHDPASASAVARSSAVASLQSGDVACRTNNVDVDTSHFQAGGYVAVVVTCNTDLSSMSLLRIPGSKSVTSRFVSEIDTYRSVR